MNRFITLVQIALLGLTLQAQENRLALVIGNSNYEYGGILRNPVNDAMAMENALSDLGFKVMAYYNLDQGGLKKAIDDFGMSLWNHDVGLFYYAGHGIQVDGSNYLIPVDANLISERHVEYDCVPAARVLDNMDASECRVNIMILDACRNNPFERSWSRSANGKGLAFMNAPSGSLIAYATAPGNTASDGEGINGIYTAAILEYIGLPDITVIQVFQNVRTRVSQRTRNQQIPWESTSLTGDFYFNPQRSLPASSQPDSFSVGMPGSVQYTDSAKIDVSRRVFMDQRDQNEYEWVKIGEQVWMAENLRYGGEQCTYCDSIYGGYYTWESAQKVCPDGWHLPSEEEWQELEKHLGIESPQLERYIWRGTDQGGRLKATGNSYWKSSLIEANNETGFSALPAGLYYGGSLFQIGKEAYFWTSTRLDLIGPVSRRLRYNRNTISKDALLQPKAGMSVRCIQD